VASQRNEDRGEREQRRDDGQQDARRGAGQGGKSEWMQASDSPADAPIGDAEKQGHDLLGRTSTRNDAVAGPGGLNGLDDRDPNRDRSASARSNEPGTQTGPRGDVGSRQADGK